MNILKKNRNMLACVLPFALYVVLTQVPSQFPEFYPMLYTAVVVIVGVVAAYFIYGSGLLRPHWNIGPGLIIGVLGICLWIGLCSLSIEAGLAEYLPEWLQPGTRAGFNPDGSIGFIIVRMTGLAIVVPVAEELFWRCFLIRWIVSGDWESVEIGKFTPGSFAWVIFLFTLAHPEWIAAAVYCALLNGLLYWKRDLWNCVVAHAVSNFILGVYVLSTGTWDLW